MVRLRNFLCHMGTPLEGRPENLPSSLPTQGRLPPSREVNLRYATPGCLRPLSEAPRSQSNNHTVNEIGATTQVKYLASIPWYHLFPKGNGHTLRALPLNNLAASFLFRPFPGCEVRWSLVPQSYAFHKSHASIKKWSTLSLPHYQIGNISLVTINYITSELVRLKEGC